MPTEGRGDSGLGGTDRCSEVGEVCRVACNCCCRDLLMNEAHSGSRKLTPPPLPATHWFCPFQFSPWWALWSLKSSMLLCPLPSLEHKPNSFPFCPASQTQDEQLHIRSFTIAMKLMSTVQGTVEEPFRGLAVLLTEGTGPGLGLDRCS